MASVDIRDVRKSFGPVEVLHGVSVSIDDGEFVVLVGPSGCGKSTLLRMLAGLENITSGEIAIDERVVNHVHPKERDIAMVFQNYALYPHMTVGQNMGFSSQAAQIRQRQRLRRRVSQALPRSSGSVPRSSIAFRVSYPAASASGSRWAAPLFAIRKCLPVRRATVEPRRQAARSRCAPRSRRCTSALRRPRSTSPTTRSRR